MTSDKAAVLTKTDRVPQQAGPMQSAIFGAVLGVDSVGHCLAMATIFFTGALSAGLGLATAVFVMSSLCSTLALYAFSQFRPGLGIAQDTSVAILAPVVSIAALGAAGPPQVQVATAFAAIGVAAVLSGVAFWLAGKLRLGRLLRMFPYPVAAGFLASSGFLLVYSALVILTGAGSYGSMAAALTDPAVSLSVLAAVAMAAALLIGMRQRNGTLLVVAIVLLFLAGFYGFVRLAGIDHDSAVALGLLPQTGSQGGLKPGLWLYQMADWSQIPAMALTLSAVVLVNLIAILLNMSGVEIAARRDVNENRELRSSGLVNILVGAIGGTASFMQGGATIIATRLGVRPGALVLGHSLVLLAAFFLAAQIVAAVPTFIAAGLLIFIGLAMLQDWLIATARRMIVQDWLIVLGILILTASVGILPAVGAGLGLAMLTFVIGFIRLPIIRSTSSAALRHSILDRPAVETEVLRRVGDQIRILHLQGPLFFGSVEQLIAQLRPITQVTADRSGPPMALILEFSEVSTFDSSACAAMQKLGQTMQDQGIAVHLAAMPAQLETMFHRWGLNLAGGMFQVWPGFEAALEACETRLLDAQSPRPVPPDPAMLLLQLGENHPRTADLLALTSTIDLVPGQALIRAADDSRDIFFLVSGRLGVFLTGLSGPKISGPQVAVRAMGPGAIVGEVASLLGQPRSADVICQEPARVLCLSYETIHRLRSEDADLAALLALVLARSLALKVIQTNALLFRSQTSRT